MQYNYFKRSLGIFALAAYLAAPATGESWTIDNTAYEATLATEETITDGVVHKLYKLSGGSNLEVQVIEVDMTNTDLDIMTNKARANNRVCDDAITFKSVKAQADEVKATGKQALVGMNADFFLSTGNLNHQMSNGNFEKFGTNIQKKKQPRWYMTERRTFGMTQYTVRPTVTVYADGAAEGTPIIDNTVIAIGVGINAGSSTFQIFTPAPGRTTGSTNGKECFAELIEGELALNGAAKFRIIDTVEDDAHKCNDGGAYGNSSLDKYYVLFGLKGLGQTTLEGLKSGDVIEFTFPTEYIDEFDIKEIIGGSLRLLVDGKVQNLTTKGDDAQTRQDDGNPTGNEPRAGIGYTNDNSKFFMVVVDGRRAGASEGCTMAQFADIFKFIGADNAFNLDGGGSATLYNAFTDELYNWPTDGMNWAAGLKGNQRAVPNTLWVVKDNNSGVEDAIAGDTDANAPIEYYNLQGIRVANPESGLFIRRQGNKANKIVL